MKAKLLKLEGILFNKIVCSSSYSTLEPTSIKCLIRDIKLFIWLDIDFLSFVLNLNKCNFIENFAFIAFALNSWINCSHIYLDDFVRLTWCNCESERASLIMELALWSLLSYLSNCFVSIVSTFVCFIFYSLITFVLFLSMYGNLGH